LYGALWNSKYVTGTVEEVLTGISGRRATVTLKDKWNLPGRESHKFTNLRRAHAGEAPRSICASRELTLCDPSPVRPDDIEEEVAGRQVKGAPYSEDDGGTVHREAIDESVGVTVVANSVEWIAKRALQPIGRPVPGRVWAVQSVSGDTITENGDDIRMMTRSPYEYFMDMFPQDQLACIVRLTSRGLEDRDTTATSAGEVLKFIGVLSLATRFEFGNWHDLWSTTGANRLMKGPNFRAKTGMSRNRFDELWSCMMFSDQTDQRENESSVQQRWKLVTDFVDSINDHRRVHFTTSEVMCVDESISRWYG
jgi:Transposase IS4